MEREVLTFRDKVGKILMSLGLGLIILGLVFVLVWLAMPSGTLFPSKPFIIMIFVAVALIRLSFYTK